ncbi:hypothetical protein Y032_0141g2258 [Ancylostoma ceylanicum]|uniref:Reverse transcriptase domain-containing protein n=1 Tax=Ancylostoma ceylanicum TaxID=53326 RepID=A0A016T3W3_9BILA|nr:hypothetical protein Y032_0141g2258 [Ancylostoma ceylanicum]
MLQSLNDWTGYVDQGSSVDVVYLDFAKAFDRVCHRLLIKKLEAVGIHPRITAWVDEFLTNREFLVRVNSTFSRPRLASSGVPQGAVLSPVLFNIYTYDLAEAALGHGVKYCAFADDWKVYYPVNVQGDRELLQQAIDRVLSWSQLWKLPLLETKTKILHIGRNNNLFSYTLGQETIQPVNEVLDLGFLVDRELSFDAHCHQIALKANRIMYSSFRALSTRNPSVLLRVFKTYIRPILEYGTVVFNPSKRKSILELENVQNSFTRKLLIRVMGFLYDSIPTSVVRNKNLGLHSLSYRRRKHDLLLVYKIVHGLVGLAPNSMFEVRASCTRGSADKLIIARPRKSIRRRFFVYRAGTDYERLSKKQFIPSKLSSFERLLNSYLKS